MGSVGGGAMLLLARVPAADGQAREMRLTLTASSHSTCRPPETAKVFTVGNAYKQWGNCACGADIVCHTLQAGVGRQGSPGQPHHHAFKKNGVRDKHYLGIHRCSLVCPGTALRCSWQLSHLAIMSSSLSTARNPKGHPMLSCLRDCVVLLAYASATGILMSLEMCMHHACRHGSG